MRKMKKLTIEKWIEIANYLYDFDQEKLHHLSSLLNKDFPKTYHVDETIRMHKALSKIRIKLENTIRKQYPHAPSLFYGQREHKVIQLKRYFKEYRKEAGHERHDQV